MRMFYSILKAGKVTERMVVVAVVCVCVLGGYVNQKIKKCNHIFSATELK